MPWNLTMHEMHLLWFYAILKREQLGINTRTLEWRRNEHAYLTRQSAVRVICVHSTIKWISPCFCTFLCCLQHKFLTDLIISSFYGSLNIPVSTAWGQCMGNTWCLPPAAPSAATPLIFTPATGRCHSLADIQCASNVSQYSRTDVLRARWCSTLQSPTICGTSCL